MIDLDYERAVELKWLVARAGWRPFGNRGRWFNPWEDDYFEGIIDELALYCGLGPAWEEWKKQPYVPPSS